MTRRAWRRSAARAGTWRTRGGCARAPRACASRAGCMPCARCSGSRPPPARCGPASVSGCGRMRHRPACQHETVLAPCCSGTLHGQCARTAGAAGGACLSCSMLSAVYRANVQGHCYRVHCAVGIQACVVGFDFFVCSILIGDARFFNNHSVTAPRLPMHSLSCATISCPSFVLQAAYVEYRSRSFVLGRKLFAILCALPQEVPLA